jgi:hypothetical protein
MKARQVPATANLQARALQGEQFMHAPEDACGNSQQM